ncbi:MAG: hypothetical protein JKY22_11615 [Flavobacteriaceae bacterium]|nr:hypothetical protein [Flavobacteriaceae bacterium]
MDLLSFLFDAIFYASITSILSIGIREFGLYNLASGAWLILGGWVGAFFFGLITGVNVPCNSSILIFAIVFLFLQVFLVYLLGNRFRSNKLTYLFISLGISLIIINVVPEFSLDSNYAVIPIEASSSNKIAFCVFALLTIICPYYIFKTSNWSKSVLNFRANKISKKAKSKNSNNSTS